MKGGFAADSDLVSSRTPRDEAGEGWRYCAYVDENRPPCWTLLLELPATLCEARAVDHGVIDKSLFFSNIEETVALTLTLHIVLSATAGRASSIKKQGA